MSLKSISFQEFEPGEPRHWILDKFELSDINLLVGKNSTGKSRVLSVIYFLCRVISGAQDGVVMAGEFTAEIDLDGQQYLYKIAFSNNQVFKESLSVNGESRLERNADGTGTVYFASENKNIPFKIEPNVVAIQNKNDRLQHPYIHDLVTWAAGTAVYSFGSDFGKSTVMHVPMAKPIASDVQPPIPQINNTVATYVDAFNRFGEAFDQALIRDMKKLGYHLAEVAVEPLSNLNIGVQNNSIVGLVVVENDLAGLRNPQMNMSQGMFRALALIIHLNLAIMSHEKRLLLIDDIGEGLDFERASEIIDLVIDAARRGGLQVIMTSNDRFVMNRVPLDYWAVLVRNKRHVKAFTRKNAPEQFEEFKFIGLSNFDFFKDSNFQLAPEQ